MNELSSDDVPLRGRGGGSWSSKEYMELKKAKLKSQLDCDRQRISDIFKGVIIYVNGFTDPPAETLRRIMQLHGGDYVTYPSRTNITHVIATNLCTAKQKVIKNLRIVRPEWITDSLDANKRLPIGPYILYNREGRNQQILQFSTMNEPKHDTTRNHFKNSCRDERNDSLPSKDNNNMTLCSVKKKHNPGFALQRKQKSYDLPTSHTSANDNISTTTNNKIGSETKDNNCFSQSKSTHKPHPSIEGKMSHVGMPHTGNGNTTTNTSTILTTSTTEAATSNGKQELSDALDDLKKYGPLASGNNPDFIENFLSNSRLHHLSTSGTFAKAYIRKLQRNHQQRAKNTNCEMEDLTFAPPKDANRVVVHIDLDAFFVSVGLLTRPHLRDKPVVLAHGQKEGTAEISSCNYIARKYGVRNGTNMRTARERCPSSLVVIPYEFAAYKKKSEEFYRVLCSFTLRIVAVSMDEAFLDLTGLVQPDYGPTTSNRNLISYSQSSPASPYNGTHNSTNTNSIALENKRADEIRNEETNVEDIGNSEKKERGKHLPTASAFVERVREAVFNKTGLRCSAGIASNITLARMATRRAKPNGQKSVPPNEGAKLIEAEPVSFLPGVGWRINRKLRDLNVTTCGDMRMLSMALLQKEFGNGTGEVLYKACRGIDERPLKPNTPQKSVSIEITWGIRFATEEQVVTFLDKLSVEVVNRLNLIDSVAKTLTLKMKRKRPGAKQPYKMLGHGSCDDHSKAMKFSQHTACLDVIQDASRRLYPILNIPPTDIRGIGISLTNLMDASEKQTKRQQEKKRKLVTMLTRRPISDNKDSTMSNPAATTSTSKIKAVPEQPATHLPLSKSTSAAQRKRKGSKSPTKSKAKKGQRGRPRKHDHHQNEQHISQFLKNTTTSSTRSSTKSASSIVKPQEDQIHQLVIKLRSKEVDVRVLMDLPVALQKEVLFQGKILSKQEFDLFAATDKRFILNLLTPQKKKSPSVAYLPSPSQWCDDVMKELPRNVVKELQRERARLHPPNKYSLRSSQHRNLNSQGKHPNPTCKEGVNDDGGEGMNDVDCESELKTINAAKKAKTSSSLGNTVVFPSNGGMKERGKAMRGEKEDDEEEEPVVLTSTPKAHLSIPRFGKEPLPDLFDSDEEEDPFYGDEADQSEFIKRNNGKEADLSFEGRSYEKAREGNGQNEGLLHDIGLITSSQIDQEYINALPHHLRKEVIQDLARQEHRRQQQRSGGKGFEQNINSKNIEREEDDNGDDDEEEEEEEEKRGSRRMQSKNENGIGSDDEEVVVVDCNDSQHAISLSDESVAHSQYAGKEEEDHSASNVVLFGQKETYRREANVFSLAAEGALKLYSDKTPHLMLCIEEKSCNQMIIDWCKHCPFPLDEQKQAIVQYVTALARDKDVVRMHKTLRLCRRHMMASEEWKECFNKQLLPSTNKTVNHLFGCDIPIPPIK
eukprot:m.187459 g.187459  ORF g.187459 m.187459 type:complete len:1444 (+) comp13625_c1_seq1:91-4422(+)